MLGEPLPDLAKAIDRRARSMLVRSAAAGFSALVTTESRGRKRKQNREK